MRNKRETITFNELVPKNSTITLNGSVLADGTIEELVVKFYVGQELGLQVRPYIRNRALNDMQPIIKYAGSKKYIDGDDDIFTFKNTIAVEKDDEIVMELTNTSLEYDYNAVVYVTVDYRGGKQSVIGGLV